MAHRVAVTSETDIRVRDVAAKVLQECQNGLPSRVIGLAGRQSALDGLTDYARAIGADLRCSGEGIDLLVPRAVVTVQPAGDQLLVVAGHRLEPREGTGGATGELADGALVPGQAGWPDGQRASLLDGERPGDVLACADILAGLLYAPLDDALRPTLRELARDGGHLVATLAANVLNRAGEEPAVPGFVIQHSPASTIPRQDHAGDGTFTEDWAARIDVDEYAFYEATHPGYADQVRVMGHMIRGLGGQPKSILDVGSGPGLPTMMLSELFPEAAIDAVEPDTTAFGYLTYAVAGWPIVSHNCGIADFPGQSRYPVVVSVGSSHHMDTRVFLNCLYRLVQPGGLVVIADEMISPFADTDSRTRNLIDHHFSYIDEALAHVEPGSLPELERSRLQKFRDVDRGVASLRRLLEETSRDRVPLGKTGGPWQRVRFAVLELEALVAGIDYDVERKTYPANFLAMARDSGLQPLEHKRVRATCGDGELDAGTHVVALRRPPH